MKRIALLTATASLFLVIAGTAQAVDHGVGFAAQAKHAKSAKHSKHAKPHAKQHRKHTQPQQQPADAPAT